jgi:hypothetical protein
LGVDLHCFRQVFSQKKQMPFYARFFETIPESIPLFAGVTRLKNLNVPDSPFLPGKPVLMVLFALFLPEDLWSFSG